MKKKIFVSLGTAVLMVLCLFPAVSLAADSTIDLKLYADGSVINIGAGDTAVIVDTAVPATTHQGIQIVCGAGANVTLQGVTINNAITFGVSPLSFTGGGNTLTLLSSSVNTLTGGMDAPAVRVESGTELTINGTGTLNAEGLGDAAGIGGGAGKDGGTISITDGTVTAKSGYSAGIGGGFEHNGGTVNISGGTVTATANQGAGIGGGAGGAGGTVNISGGTVNATADQGAGIGGGESGAGGAVNISGGTVTAIGNGGAGIGGGIFGAGGAVSITGGIVTADGNGMGFDIGSGQGSGAGGTLSADGAAGITLASSGTNAAVTLGTCGMTGYGAGSLAGVYINGAKYTSGSVINVASMGSGTGYTYSSPVFTINEDREYLIWNGTDANRIVVSPGVSADIILFGTSIQPATGCPFIMSGATVDITLMGSSVLKSSPGYNGLLCPSGATLTISGNGSLKATASNNTSGVAGSGIGGNASTACGSITINSGTVTAKGGSTRGGKIGLAGIGGAVVNITGGTVNAFSYRSGYAIGEKSNADSSITITGGTVNATAGVSNYGIGGKGSDAPNITISGGNVTATGDSTFPAIGSSGGKLNISGGTVTAYSKFGSGIAVYSGETNISGGTVYASGDPTQAKDIGTPPGFEGTLNISGEAMVFLKNNSCNTPVTAHINETFPAGTSEVYGAAISPPDTWTSGFGAYLKPYTLSFNANGGSGTAPDIKRLYNAKASLPDGSGFARDNYTFKGWNTEADGSGKGYAACDTFTFTADTALYAQWTAHPALTSSVADAKINTGGSIVLTPNIGGGTWNWDKTFFSASFNSPATFTALKPGTSCITYTVEGKTASYEVTIEQAAPVLTSSDADAKIYTGGRIVLTPDIGGGTWNWDKTFFSATFGQGATFTALKQGTSVITYTAGGQTVSYSVTIEKSDLPKTGQDSALIWALCALGLIAGAAAVLLKKRSKAGTGA